MGYDNTVTAEDLLVQSKAQDSDETYYLWDILRSNSDETYYLILPLGYDSTVAVFRTCWYALKHRTVMRHITCGL